MAAWRAVESTGLKEESYLDLLAAKPLWRGLGPSLLASPSAFPIRPGHLHSFPTVSWPAPPPTITRLSLRRSLHALAEAAAML